MPHAAVGRRCRHPVGSLTDAGRPLATRYKRSLLVFPCRPWWRIMVTVEDEEQDHGAR